MTPSVQALERDLQTGRFAHAEAGARTLLQEHPDDFGARVILAVALGAQNRLREALPLYRQLADEQPHEAAHLSNLATALRECGELDEAEQAYRRALALRPADPALLANLGLLRWQRGDAVETRNLMLEACTAAPDMAEPRIYGALACHACAEDEQARRLIADCAHWPELDPVLEADLAMAELQLEQVEAAHRRLQRLLHRAPDSVRARVRMAGLLERLNRTDEAETMLAGIDLAADDEGSALRAALQLRAGQPAQARAAYEQLVAHSPAAACAPYHFALAKACDQLGDAEGAMRALDAAHALQMQTAARLAPDLVDPASAPLRIADQRIRAQERAGWRDSSGADSAQSPVFIVGFPRSGTTLLEQMLDAHPRLRSMDERAFVQDVIEGMAALGFAYPRDLGRLDARSCTRLREIYWRRVASVVRLEPGERLVDKNPLNILRLPMLARIFPQAHFILALRHPLDVVLSCHMQSFRAPAFQFLCASLDRLARGYGKAMDFWADQSQVFDVRQLQLRHEDLVGDPAAHARQLAGFLAIGEAESMLHFDQRVREKGFIGTPSYAQVAETINPRGLGRWRRYRPWLEPVMPLLAPWCTRFGYRLD